MRRIGLLAAAMLLFPVSLPAWTAESDIRIATKASQLAPPDLKLLLDKYQSEYLRGVAAASSDEGSDKHLFIVNSRRGRLRDQLQREVADAISIMHNRRPVSDFVSRLGVISHLLSDANNPFHVDDSDPRLAACRDDFERYAARKSSSFPTVFYGLEPQFRLQPFVDSTLSRTASFYPLLSEEYFRFGERRTSADFDDRSTAFGIASVSYSHAVTDVVNVYYYIWKEVGGDVRSAAVMQRSNLLLDQSLFRQSAERPFLGRSGE